MNCPKHIENLEQVLNQIENDKNYVIVIDGNNKSFKLTEMPEHGKPSCKRQKVIFQELILKSDIKCDAEGPVLSAIWEERTWINCRKYKIDFQ